MIKITKNHPYLYHGSKIILGTLGLVPAMGCTIIADIAANPQTQRQLVELFQTHGEPYVTERGLWFQYELSTTIQLSLCTAAIIDGIVGIIKTKKKIQNREMAKDSKPTS